MNAGDIPESEIFMVNELSGFGIKLHNQRGKAEVIGYEEWINNHGLKDWFYHQILLSIRC